jgi:hypothetical protein
MKTKKTKTHNDKHNDKPVIHEDTSLLSPQEIDVKEALEHIEGYKYHQIMDRGGSGLTFGDY